MIAIPITHAQQKLLQPTIVEFMFLSTLFSHSQSPTEISLLPSP